MAQLDVAKSAVFVPQRLVETKDNDMLRVACALSGTGKFLESNYKFFFTNRI